MGAKKNDISQINKYLKGQLGAKDMHQLERQAQADPFLMDALEGFEKAGTDQSGNLADLQARLANRVAKNKTRSILLWRVLPMAACLLLMLGGGYWLLSRPNDKVHYADNIPVESKLKPKGAEAPPTLKERSKIVAHNETTKKAAAAVVANAKTDKVKYTATTIRLKEKSTVEEVVKGMARLEVDSTGAIIKQGKILTTAKLNGKIFSGGNIDDALKNLPADIREKVQIIDDYGDVLKKETVGLNGNKARVADLKPTYKSGSFGSLANPPRVGQAPLPPGKVIVTGTVLDAVSKEPLTGTTIGTQKDGSLTQADINGNYAVTVDKGAVLTYNFVSYAPQSHKLTLGENAVNINMTTDAKQASEVVIRGYVKRDRDVNTGSSYIISAKVQDYPVGNVEQLLQGKVAGLNIQNNTGAPGVRGSVNIRGLSAPAAVTDPSAKPFLIKLKVINDMGSPAEGALISLNDWSGTVKADGKFETVSMGATVIGVSMPGYVSQFVKFNKDDSITVALKKSRLITCNENIEFRKQFENNIAIAEKFTIGRFIGRSKVITPEEFNAAIKFIARYINVSIGTKANARYKDVDAFMADKVKWLTWYEGRKCKGLK